MPGSIFALNLWQVFSAPQGGKLAGHYDHKVAILFLLQRIVCCCLADYNSGFGARQECLLYRRISA
ncbi:hypothetical protein C4F51_08625 [Cellvibrio sp. KB43]|uniref:Uncharacterized protein n=1 Tax=Cellvibrio polysaccharolyticus TaxID=2082724 RepID=A0A928V642_9GAMM|nr:hypothetical protein [Cellvibrio polysaccharolyticus]